MFLRDCLAAFFVRDEFEDALNLPHGKYEIPLVLYDRLFDLEGQLNYPVSGDAKSPWVPEVFGDAILINGKLFPYLEVEPRKYRFRVLNGSERPIFSSLPDAKRFPVNASFKLSTRSAPIRDYCRARSIATLCRLRRPSALM